MDDLQTAIIIAHARGYFAGILEATRFMSGVNRDVALAKHMHRYEIDHPEYARIKDD
jgi:hypothetical protein